VIVGVPREVKKDEYRVAMVPAGVRQLTLAGHEVLLQAGAGMGSGVTDSEYESEGARIVGTAEEAWSAQVVVKVKEPVAEEYRYFREGLVLYTFLHLAAAPELARVLMDSGITAIGYETVQEPDGLLPILAPMSEVAGRMAVQAGAKYLEKEHGGRGIPSQAAQDGGDLRRTGGDTCFQSTQHTGRGERGRSFDRGRAGDRGEGAMACYAGHAQYNEN